MINWTETKKLLNREYGDISGINPKVIMQCDMCGTRKQRTIKTKKHVINNQMDWKCMKCLCQDPKVKENRSKASKNKWKNQNFRKKMDKYFKGNGKKIMSENTKNLWKNEDYQNKIAKSSKEKWNDDKYKNKMKQLLTGNTKISQNMKNKWKDENYRNKITNSSKKLWENNREKMMDIFHSDEYRKKLIETHNTKEFIDKMKSIGTKMWSNPDHMLKMRNIFKSDEYRSNLSNAMLKKWKDPNYRQKMSRRYGK